MTDPAARYRGAVDWLAGGREINVLDDLAHLAVSEEAAFAQGLAGLREHASRDPAPLEAFLGGPWGDTLLAAGLAVVPYASPRGHIALVRALEYLARRAVGSPSNFEPYALAGIPVIARVVWAWTAQALATEALSFLPILRGATLPGYPGQRPMTMVRDFRLRYPAALGSNAGTAFAYYRDWLATRDWLASCVPYLASDPASYVGEADLLLALAALEDDHRTFSAAATNDSVVRLLAATILRAPDHLGEFLGVPGADVVDAAVARWGSLEHSGHYFDRVELAPLLTPPER